MASEPKKAKLEENGFQETQEDLDSFKGFKIVKILNENSDRKNVCIEGTFADNRRSVVVLERLPLRQDILPELLSEKTKLRKELTNDIYGQYECLFPGDEKLGIHSLKANVILPATDKHIAKYTDSPTYIVNETPQLYHFITLPFIDSERFTIDWVYNILDHKKESERIIYEDPDPETGFVILPDFKWSGKQVEDLYLIGIVHSKGIKSVRDLKQKHLPLLRKLWNDGTEAIATRYGVPRSQIRAYFHYQPSYYHLHVHYTHIRYNAPGITVDRAHLLPVVLRNLEQDSHYYSKALLPFTVKETDKLFKVYKNSGYDFEMRSSKNKFKIPLDFFKMLGRAKHEPCGEHWNISYGDSAWRMAIVALCLKCPADKVTVAKLSLASAFTCFGNSTDQDSEWSAKVDEVRKGLDEHLPLEKAAFLYHLYLQHVSSRRKACISSECHKVYRQIMELEEAFLLFEELQIEGEGSSFDKVEMQRHLSRRIAEIPFEGNEGSGKSENVLALMNFFLKISHLTHLKRTGWVRSKVRDPERVSGHMFRMGVMALLLEEEEDRDSVLTDVTNSTMVISLVHDLAECIVGDITPSDPVTPEEKHKLEVEAMEKLIQNLPRGLADQFRGAFQRYESGSESDKYAIETKDLDKFDMVMQAYEYEEKEKRFGDLTDFFRSTSRPDLFKNALIKDWDLEVRELREERINQSMNTKENKSS